MKFKLTLLVILLSSISIYSQTPEKMSFQAVIRNGSGDLVSNSSVGMRISILKSSNTGSVVYSETHLVTSNANGLVTLQVGDGTVVSGSFTTIDWAADTYFIKHETDIQGGTNYTIEGTSQFLSVPYALNAKKAENVFSGDYNDLTNTPKIDNVVTYEVGDVAQGGIVFWVDETKQHGLVVAKTNQTAAKWGAFEYTQARGDGLYSGQNNSLIAMIFNFDAASDKSSPELFAARSCLQLKITENNITYGDWYLPSKYELNLLYQNKAAINAAATANGGQALLEDAYWSSTEISDNNAWGLGFDTGQEAQILKSFANNIRAIRAF